MANTDITSKTMDGMGPHGAKVGLLRVLGPAHVWALGVGIVLVGEYMGWNFAVGKGGAYAALIACWFAGILYSCVAMIDSEVTSTVAAAGGQYTQAKHIVGPLMAFNVGLYLVFAYTMLEAGNAITLGYLISVAADMTGATEAIDQKPFIILSIMFLAWLNYRGVLATLTFNLVITAFAFSSILILFLALPVATVWVVSVAVIQKKEPNTFATGAGGGNSGERAIAQKTKAKPNAPKSVTKSATRITSKSASAQIAVNIPQPHGPPRRPISVNGVYVPAINT